MSGINQLKKEAIGLLQALIATPSLSKKEDQTALKIEQYLRSKDIVCFRHGNNVWARNLHWSDQKPVILLNSHHDTVAPVSSWTRNPYEASIENQVLYGLGSNDAGGSLVALMATFTALYAQPDLPYNLILAASAEEEISGKNGIAALLPELGNIDFGIVGEPTLGQLAVAERGLMVIDAVAKGQAGHAAREEGINAIYRALKDIDWLQNYAFEQDSEWLGPVKISVTQINAGKQHNIVPDECHFVIDVRNNGAYSNEAIFNILQQHTQSKLEARSFRLQASQLEKSHPILSRGAQLGLQSYGSPTLSDQALMAFPTVKVGCGDSARSHTANEYIRLDEISSGIDLYLNLLNHFQLHAN